MYILYLPVVLYCLLVFTLLYAHCKPLFRVIRLLLLYVVLDFALCASESDVTSLATYLRAHRTLR